MLKFTGSSIAECSASQRRQNTEEFVEVTNQEFQSVSSLIRGRVKLTDVNSVSTFFFIRNFILYICCQIENTWFFVTLLKKRCYIGIAMSLCPFAHNENYMLAIT